MSTTTTDRPTGVPTYDRPQAPSKLPRTLGGLALLLAVLACAWFLEDARWERLLDVPGNLAQYFGRMGDGVANDPTAEPYAEWWTAAFDKMLESVQIAWIGTLIGAMFSFPLAFLAANNTAPAGLRFVVRMLFNVIRSIPELILAIVVMIPIFGIGVPLAGAMAIGIHSIGSLGKLTLEEIEGVDRRPIEAVRASGASWWQTIRVSVIPQMLPETIAFWLYRFEVNIRASAILGAIGAGGVGALLTDLFSHRLWERIGITLLVIIGVTIIVDQISAWVRHRIIHGAPRAAAVEP